MNVLPQIKIDQVKTMFSDGFGIRSIMTEAGVARGTAARYRKLLLEDKGIVLCACGRRIGHKGWCSVRVERSPLRQEFLATHPIFGATRVSHARVKKPIFKLDRFLRWPYVVYGKNIPDIVIKVHEAVPLTIPEKMRPDICQDIIMDILAGELDISMVATLIARYVNKHCKRVQDYRTLSLYQPIRGTDNLMLIDTISKNELWDDGISYG